MFTYKVKIKINASGATQNVTVSADNQNAAQRLAEMQYGKSNIVAIWR